MREGPLVGPAEGNGGARANAWHRAGGEDGLKIRTREVAGEEKVTQKVSDAQKLIPMQEQIGAHHRRQATELSADAGYFSEDNPQRAVTTAYSGLCGGG